MNKLHAHVFKGSLLSATLKKRLDGLAKGAAAKKAKPTANESQKKAGPAPNRASRLIVRNLPFDITEQDLRAIFLPHGPIYSVHIPLAPVVQNEDDVKTEQEDAKPVMRSKGFAFVWFLSRKDAEKAMEGCNGMTVEAGMADTLVSDKQKKKKQRREEKKLKAKGGEEAADEEGDEQDEGASRRRVIAVDWALSKDKWEAEKAKMEAENDDEAMSDEDSEDGDDDSDDGSSEDGSDSEDEQLGVHEDGSDDSGSEADSDDSHSEDESADDDDEKPAKPTLPPPEVGTTVFVRNVPFEATEDELRTLYVHLTSLHTSTAHTVSRFRAFGPLRYARITMDVATGRSRGTGFACFWNKEDADKAIQQSTILRAETMGDESAMVSIPLHDAVYFLSFPFTGQEEPIQDAVPAHTRSIGFDSAKSCATRANARCEPRSYSRRGEQAQGGR